MNTMTLEASLSPAPPSSRSGEDELALRLAQGDAAAVGEAYDRHHEAVRRFSRRLLGDEAAGEDLVQDVFLQLPRAARRFRGDAALRTFLLSIAVNLCRRHVRTAVRRRARLDKVEREPRSPVHGECSTPEREVERQQLAAVLTLALDQLSVDHRTAFVLCEVEQRTSREVASIVGVPEATVRTRLHHAKRKLRAFLEREGLP